MSTSSVAPEANVPQPTAQQQQVLDRIGVQRERLRTRRLLRLQAQAATQEAQGSAADAPLTLRLAVFAKEHPVAAATVAGAALVAGPTRLMRWAGVALPLIMRLRSR